MDVLVLIDKLDDLVHNAKAVPLTDQVRIDREEIYDILDQMRATIPEEIKQARWIVKERQEMLAEAKRECDRILGEAREQAVREASQTELVKLADRPVPEDVVTRILDAGRVAGSGSNKQPWTFVVVDMERKERLAESVYVAGNVRSAALVIVIATPGGGRVLDVGRAMQNMMLVA